MCVKPIPSIEEIEKALDLRADKWSGRCFAVAERVVSAGLVKGRAVYGHYYGPVAKDTRWFALAAAGFIRHGWIVSERRIIDPTRWCVEGRRPRVHVTLTGDPDYDEGGSRIRLAMQGDAPPGPEEPPTDLMLFNVDLGNPAVYEFMLGVMNVPRGEPPTLRQLVWLANRPYDALQPHTIDIYRVLSETGQRALIPLDNWRRAESEAKASLVELCMIA